MRIELMRLEASGDDQSDGRSDGRSTATVRTPDGEVTVPWHGARDAAPGPYFIEWTVNEELVWGGNAKPAAVAVSQTRPAGNAVTFCGELHLDSDGLADLAVHGTIVLLDVADPPPPSAVDGTWIELTIDQAALELHPYFI